MAASDVENWDGTGTLPVLYGRTATGATTQWTCWVVDDRVWVRWGQLDGAMQEASFKCEPKNVGRSNETTAHEQAIKEAKAKWVKQVKKKYSPTLETAGKTKRFQPMLAEGYPEHKHKLEYPVIIQPKLDGARCLTYLKDGHVFLQSRGGDPWRLPHVLDALRNLVAPSVVLDGELYCHGLSLQRIMSLARKPREESKVLVYCIFDVTTPHETDWPCWDRLEWVKDFFAQVERSRRSTPVLWRVPHIVARDEVGVLEAHRLFVTEGYEGAIVRTRAGTYRMGTRSSDLLKMKEWKDAEFPIIGFTAGRGKFENAAVFSCMTKEGKVFEVTPTGTAEERLQMLHDAPGLIGKLLKVKFLDFTDEGAPTCARGIGIRDEMDLS